MRPRRDLLRSLGAALTAGLAGCSGDDPDTDQPATDDAPPTDGSTPTVTPTATLTPTPSPTPSPTPTPEPTPTFSETIRTPVFEPGGGDLTAFGTEVALADGLAVAGSPAEDDGSVYVFESGSDRWTQAATFVPDDATNFGRAVALAGETVVAGAPGTDSQGAAYVFERTADGWTRRTRLRPPSDDGDDFREFGRSVAYDGATAVVGDVEVHLGPEAPFTGQVFVFEGSGADWTDGTRITTGDFDLFGTDVAVAGDRLLVGAPHAETAPDTNSGAVYEYERTGGEWQRTATIVPEDAAHHELFGGTVALDGTTAVVAAPGLDGPGAAYVFERTDGEWRQQARLTPGADDAISAEPDSFGVALADGVAVVGVPQAPESGRAYTFERVDGEWRRAAALVPADPDPEVDDFGWSVALDGDTAFVGAPLAFGPRRGTGYLFDV